MTKEKDFFSEENEPESNWFAFKEVGDNVSGTLLSRTEKEGNYGPQMVYELETEGGVVNVGILTKKKFIVSAMNKAKIGQKVGFKYTDDFQNDEMKKKGFAPAKNIKVFLDKSYDPMEEVASAEGIDVKDVPFD